MIPPKLLEPVLTILTVLALGAMVVLLSACPATKDPDSPSPRPFPIPDTELCGAMCKHIGPVDAGGLGCEEGEPYYDSDEPGDAGLPNITCENGCKKMQDNGVYVNPRCVMHVKSCAEIEAARQRTDCE